MANKFKYTNFREANEALRQQEIQRILPKATAEMVVSKVPISALRENAENADMSMDGIDDLAASIRDVGLQQPLVVVPETDSELYRILSGHRRFRAMQQLAQEDNRFAEVPCYVRDLKSVVLPLPDSEKELYILATTNAEARQLTTGDKMAIVRQLTTIYRALQENGYTGIGNRRTFIAEKMKVSESQVQRIEFVDKNIISDFHGATENDVIPMSVAETIAHLSTDQQSEFAEQLAGELPSAHQVRKYVKHKEKVVIVRPTLTSQKYEITPADEIAEISKKMELLDSQIEKLTLRKKNYARLLELKRIILEKMNEMEQIIHQ